MRQNAGMPLATVEAVPLARWLARVGDRPDDLVDLFLERREEVEHPGEPGGPGLRVGRDQGLAVRLVRDGRSYLASADELDGRAFAEAVRRVARTAPRTGPAEPELAAPAWEPLAGAAALGAFADSVRAALRERLVAFPLQLRVRRHRRWVQTIGPRLAATPEREELFSAVGETPWGRRGRLLTALDGAAAGELAGSLAALFHAREAPPPPRARQPVLLAPGAAAVFLHEAVAHALEADLLALGGRPEAAIGLPLAPPWLSVLDDPAAAPPGLARGVDDEGLPVVRRWLVRAGRVEQPLADALWARLCPALLPGSGWRGSRHDLPVPRTRYLQLLAGDLPLASLWRRADGGLWVEEVERGGLDPHTGLLALEVTAARRLRGGEPAEPVGRCTVRGRLAELLAGLAGVGNEAVLSGAGWCGKRGQRQPVWARAAPLLLGEAEVAP